MNELVLRVPERVSATYVVAVPEPMSTAEARRRASEAVEARLTGPLRMLTAESLAKGAVRVTAEPAGPPAPGLTDKPLFGTREQRAFLARAGGFVTFSTTQPASLIAVQEWKTRGPAGALAASVGGLVLDFQGFQVLTAEDALAALPDTALTVPAAIGPDVTVSLPFQPWVRVQVVDHPGIIAVVTEGMTRFALPEFRLGPASPDLREEMTALLFGVAFRFWSDLLARAQETPGASPVNLPRTLRVPAEMHFHRRDIDRANGVPNRGGAYTDIGLRFDPVQGDDLTEWLTVVPPDYWDMSWEDFIASTCHAMFGFEKPTWHYMPEFGALLDALTKASQTLPEARARFLRGDLPPGGRLMVRHEVPETDDLWWGRVESWEDARHAVVRDTGRELTSGVRPGPPVRIHTGHITDWGIWVDGLGVVEGAETEGVGSSLS